MKRYLLIILLLLADISVFGQIEYGYDRPKSSTDPWKFGINANVSQDWINQKNGIDKQIGWKAGISGEKHLVYNIYFRPVFNFAKRGFACEIENEFRNEVNAYLLDMELTIELKFGDEFRGRGFLLYFAPFFTYGISGTSTYTNLNPVDPNKVTQEHPYNPLKPEEFYPDNYLQPQDYGTFDDYQLKKEDVGFILGVGYDINHHLELNLYYVLGFLNVGSYNNFRWRSVNFGITYFF